MTDGDRFRWTSAARSHVGLVREINEDTCLNQPDRGLWAVADGMGGHSVGDVASRMVVTSLSEVRPLVDLADAVADARQRLEIANHQLRAEAAKRGVRIIGSTVVVMLACDRYCAFLWAGDSRLYLYRNGQLRLLTRDHSQAEELRVRHESGVDDVFVHSPRNVITRAVGAIDALDLDEQSLIVYDGDIFLLCSDGLSNEVNEEDIVGALLTGNCKVATETLVDLALTRGGRDNISAVVVRAEDPHASDRTILNPAL